MDCVHKPGRIAFYRYLLCGWLSLSIAFCSALSAAESPPSFVWSSYLDCQGAGMSAYGLRVDEQGNATFTGFSLNGFNIGGAATNAAGVFVIRVDRFGNLVWATHDGNDATQGHTVTCDSSGNTYVLGTLSQEGTSPKILCGMSLTGRVFLAKYDNHGQGLWAVSMASKGFGSSVDPVEITSDLDGNTYWTAEASRTVIF